MGSMLRHRRALPLVAGLTGLLLLAGGLFLGVETRAHDDDGAYLGVRLGEPRRGADGARVLSVIEGSPADRAGLEKGDVIIAVDGDEIRNTRALSRNLDDRRPGDRVDVTILRDGRERTIDVELGNVAELIEEMLGEDFGERIAETIERSLEGLDFSRLEALENLEGLEGLEQLEGLRDLEGMHFNFDFDDLHDDLDGLHERLGRFRVNVCDEGDCTFVWRGHRPRLGVGIAETTVDLRRHLGGDEDSGVLISKVYEDTPADEAGVRVGDLILSVDGEEVSNGSDVRRQLRGRAGEVVRLEIVRDGDLIDLDVELDEEADREDPARFERRHHRELRDSLRSSARVGREAAQNARSAVREALAVARSQQRVELQEARKALAEARNLARSETREAVRELREALREGRSEYRETQGRTLRELRRRLQDREDLVLL